MLSLVVFGLAIKLYHVILSAFLCNNAIENCLHWIGDVIFQEDTSPQKAGYAPSNLGWS